jgi:Domain of unknown function (DUF2017)
MRRFAPRVRRTRRGDFELRLTRQERELLRELPSQLREALPTADVGVGRLFPPAYADDPEREDEYRRLVRDDLIEQHLEALRIMEETIDARRLSEEQLTAWLGSLNDLRLVLGTRLQVTEETYERELDPDDPNASAHTLFLYLGWLEEQVVEALAGRPGN